ncbi:hypothetical protein BBO99_00001731 [Phytophthora kernoviae]|uniref:Uncharacterized protein n=2 Tax=Phytophthora kernoviae TaxID=325452 RepID=A0A3R7K8M6_9STRA|nr:hypothetical protein G195_002286 [Phytophthora kernoviae 00238/432]KAG2530916.1 hypothetical protein JM16_001419 [Phytophthora kernoviae]KAG2532034.1 hypothetical protein JM18_001500 [Phytophthora kernoviae]RLN36718.1 hypothetical protein BBI17_001516 [Phytophthora kernoviae]RLN83877.1 hypothetical protein BBO99_00001731 [Phytophthora kernoviae]
MLLADLFNIPAAELITWNCDESKDSDGQLLAEFLLGDSDDLNDLVLQFYESGWYRPLSPRKQSELAGTDTVLNDIEHSVETAARDYIPEYRVGENSDDTDDDIEMLEARRENNLRTQLQKHFARFRSITASGSAINSK